MAEGFHVFPEDIDASGKKLLDLGQKLAGDIDSFRAQTEALTGAFGDDDLGSTIAEVYQAATEQIFENYHDNAEGFSDIGQGLQETAEHYGQVDTDNQDALNRLLEGMA